MKIFLRIQDGQVLKAIKKYENHPCIKAIIQKLGSKTFKEVAIELGKLKPNKATQAN